MIRLTVEQLYALRDSIDEGGQAQCAVLPLGIVSAKSLIIAWARGREAGSEYYLTMWKDTNSVLAAKEREKKENYVFPEPDKEQVYKHVYVPEGAVLLTEGKVQVWSVDEGQEEEVETDVRESTPTGEAQATEV